MILLLSVRYPNQPPPVPGRPDEPNLTPHIQTMEQDHYFVQGELNRLPMEQEAEALTTTLSS